MSTRRCAKILLGVVAALAVIAGGAAVLLTTLDPRPLVEWYLADALGTHVTMDALAIRWGSPVAVEVKGLRIANAPWAKQRDLLRVDNAAAEIAPGPLLHGVLEFRTLKIDGASLLLERGPGRRGNWKFNRSESAAPSSPAAVPNKRVWFPTLIDFTLRNGTFTYRATSGTVLTLRIDTLTINSPSNDRPVSLVLDGAYNDTAGTISATTDSFTIMRNASMPLHALFKIETATTTTDFDGSMTDPLNFDGVTGHLQIVAHSLGDVLTIFGAPAVVTPPFQAAGALGRTGNAWRWEGLSGKLGGDEFSGRLALDEGEVGNPDAVTTALAFPHLDAKALSSGWGVAGLHGTKLQVDPHPGTTVDATITAGQLKYGTTVLTNFSGRVRSMPGEVTVNDLSFRFVGGTVLASAQAQTAGDGTRLRVAAALSEADTGEVARMLGAANGQISGRMDARAEVEMTGATVDVALKDSRGQAIVSVIQGRVARDLVEKLSSDLRGLFRSGEGSAPLTCVLAVVDMHNGLGVVAPLRLRSPEIALIGGGNINFITSGLDLRLESQPRSTGFFALDIPLEITGTFDRPSARPAVGPSVDARALDRMPALSADLLQVSDRNPCAR
jgi:uncharacterized protein involved in outer membrane biogenesis